MLSCRFEQCLEPLTMLLVEGSFETELFQHLPNQVFCSPKFQKYINCEGHLFLQNVQNSLCISKM